MRRPWSGSTRYKTATNISFLKCPQTFNIHVLFVCLPPQALSAQEDLDKTKEELKTAMTVVPAPLDNNDESDQDEHDEINEEASADLFTEGVSQLDLRSEEARVTEAQKNERVKKQLQVRRGVNPLGGSIIAFQRLHTFVILHNPLKNIRFSMLLSHRFHSQIKSVKITNTI